MGPSTRWLPASLDAGFSKAVQEMRSSLLDAAVTIQYDSAREAARQLGVDVPPEPFTQRQQRQSRMDGPRCIDCFCSVPMSAAHWRLPVHFPSLPSAKQLRVPR